MSSAEKVRVDDLVKIFGRDSAAALALLERGCSREEILRSTGSVVAIGGVSFTVRAGEIFVVMGLSGSGKSTLVRCINRLIQPTAGRIYIDDQDVVLANPDDLRRLRLTKVAMVFQHFALFPHRTVVENVEFGLKVRGIGRVPRRERALAVLEQVGLRAWADKPPASLSGGMQQRVGLARSLAVDPEVLLMDEAFSALDPLIRRDMQEELLGLQKVVKKTIIFITHDLHEALRLGDKVAIMRDGCFVQTGTPRQIVAAPADEYVASFTRDVDRGRVFTVDQIMKSARETAQVQEPIARIAERLRNSGEGNLYVVDHDGYLLGAVSRHQLNTAEGTLTLADIVQRDVPSVTLGNHLADVFPKCRRGERVAVVDDEGRLRGYLDPMDLFPLLSGKLHDRPAQQ